MNRSITSSCLIPVLPRSLASSAPRVPQRQIAPLQLASRQSSLQAQIQVVSPTWQEFAGLDLNAPVLVPVSGATWSIVPCKRYHYAIVLSYVCSLYLQPSICHRAWFLYAVPLLCCCSPLGCSGHPS